MKKIYPLFLSFLYFAVNAQTDLSNQPEKIWSLGTNPLSIAEFEAALGPCVAYKFTPHFEFWAEPSILFTGFNSVSGWRNLSGYRVILQPRYYPRKNSSFFIAVEYRLKHYRYTNTGTFTNAATHDTLSDYRHTVSQTLTGGAILFGSRAVLSAKHQLYLEVTIGAGGKTRYIKRLNVPEGYSYIHPIQRQAFSINYEKEGGLFYMPLGLRLIWQLR